MPRNLIVVLGVLGTAVVLVFLYVFWLDSTYARSFDEMAMGESEAELWRLAGSPSYVTDGSRYVEPEHPKDKSSLVKGCVKELWYAMPWPIPERYSYCFEKSGALVDKYHWVSW